MRLEVQSGQGAYSVDLGDPLEDAVGSLLGAPSVIVVDERVAELYGIALAPLFAIHPHISLPALESEKSFEGVQRVLAFLQDTNSTKRTTLIAIGGGIIQDIASFAAHVYYRGIPWVFLPSTLLAMTDSCIGAKCAINFRGFKNQVGAFHAPSRVVLTTDFLPTLSDLDILSGYGEILKLMLTKGEEAFESLVRVVSKQGFRGTHAGDLLLRCLKVKRGIIEQDEYELGLRKILNFGHTFGHALEGATDYAVPHGIAVAWGVDLANYISSNRGGLEKECFEKVHRFLAKDFLTRVAVRPDPADIFARLKRDKKVRDGKVQLILMWKPGDLRIVPTDLDQRLEDEILSYVEFAVRPEGGPR